VETFRVPPKLATQIDQAAKQMEKALTRLKLDMNIHAEFGTNEDHEWPARVPGMPTLSRAIAVGANPVSLDLRFRNSLIDPTINSAWENLWDLLGACFETRNRIRATVKYPIAPIDFVTALGAEKS
jgi:hypothetical protein